VLAVVNMGGIRENIHFIRVGTLDNPDLLPPDVHIFTESKQTWVSLPEDTPAYNEFYEWADIWSKDNFEILQSLEDKATNAKARCGLFVENESVAGLFW